MPDVWLPVQSQKGVPGRHTDNYWIGYTYKKPRNYENKTDLDLIFAKLCE